jgi:uncharacterized protein YceK
MKALITIAAIALLSGCSTVMTERVQPVSIDSANPVEFAVANRAGKRVAAGTTPAVLRLDSAVGAFKCERYTITTGERHKVVDTGISGWFWLGAVLIDGGIIDMIGGRMCTLPGKVTL